MPLGQVEVAERLADQRRGLQRLRLDDLGSAVLDGVDAADAAPADVLQDARDRHRPRIDVGVDAERLGEVVIGGVVDQHQVRLAAEALRHHAGQDVDLVVVGERDHRVGVLDVGLAEDLLVERVAVEDDGPAELVGDPDGTLPRRSMILTFVRACAARCVRAT